MTVGKFQKLAIDLAPAFLRGPNGSRFLEATGIVLDIAYQRLVEGVRAGQPLRCDVSALPSLARDRDIKLYSTEPYASQRRRLASWLPLHRTRGSAPGIMMHTQPYFLPGTLPVFRVVHQDGSGSIATWHKLDATGAYSYSQKTPSNFNYDGQNSKWSRWFGFIEMQGTGIAAPPNYGGGHYYGDGSLYGGGLTSAQTADIVAMMRDWDAAHCTCLGIALVWGGSIDPTAAPVQDADGRWSLPNGANTWGVLADPATGKATRPTNMQWIYDNPAAA